MFQFLYEVQLAIRGSLTGAVEGFAQSGDWGVLLAMMPLGIVFGAVHAMTPGALARSSVEGWIEGHGARLAVASRWLDTAAGLALIAIALYELSR